MFNNQETNRYSRHLVLSEIGIDGQEKLKSSKVLVIGAGGLSCPSLQYLAAAGVGNIGVIDFDVVEVSNLQRQILYSTNDVGTNKAIAAKKRLESLNPLIKITAYDYKLSNKNALSLFSEYDLIIDGSDNFSTRYLVNDACLITNKPLVYGAIYKFEGQISVFNYQNGPSYRCLYPDPPEQGSVPNCSEVGVIGVLPGIIGVYQATEALKIILGIGKVLEGKLLVIDVLSNNHMELNITKSQEQINQVIKAKNRFESFDYDFYCGLTTTSDKLMDSTISCSKLKELVKQEKLQIIDVREDWEIPKIPELHALNIPLKALPHNLNKISKELKTVVYCQKGGRSIQAINYLKKHGYKNLINLIGGISSY